MKTAQEIFTDAFNKPRTPRSDEFKAGTLEALQFRTKEIEHMECPYKVGTAAADAWFSGAEYGHLLWRQSQTN